MDTYTYTYVRHTCTYVYTGSTDGDEKDAVVVGLVYTYIIRTYIIHTYTQVALMETRKMLLSLDAERQARKMGRGRA